MTLSDAKIITREVAFKLPIISVKYILAMLDVFFIQVAVLISDALYPSQIVSGITEFESFVLIVGMGVIFCLPVAIYKGYTLKNLSNAAFQVKLISLSWVFMFFCMGWIAFVTKTTGSASRISIVLLFFADQKIYFDCD